jgi:hypothetical protein
MDEVQRAETDQPISGSWRSSIEPEVGMDLHTLRCSPQTESMTARAAAIMGTPGQSPYEFQTVLFHRTPTTANEQTVFDLLLEPRLGQATVKSAQAIHSDRENASGIVLKTRGGKELRIYWVPGAKPTDTTTFKDGTVLSGALAMTDGTTAAARGASRFSGAGKELAAPVPIETGTITALSPQSCSITVDGLASVAPGERICVNPKGRAHTYKIESTASNPNGTVTLALDVSPVLGKGQICNIIGNRIALAHTILARTGNLRRTRTRLLSGGSPAIIQSAYNPEKSGNRGERTVIMLEKRPTSYKVGSWIEVVDFIKGDTVVYEKQHFESVSQLFERRGRR